MRKKAGTENTIPTVIPNEITSKEFRRNWARLTQKIYEVDSLPCPRRLSTMRIINFIEELDIIERTLRRLGLWDIRNHNPPKSAIGVFSPPTAAQASMGPYFRLLIIFSSFLYLAC